MIIHTFTQLHRWIHQHLQWQFGKKDSTEKRTIFTTPNPPLPITRMHCKELSTGCPFGRNHHKVLLDGHMVSFQRKTSFLLFPLWVSEIIEAMVHMAKSNQLKFIGNSTGFRIVSALQVNLGILQIDPGLNNTKDHIDMVRWENMETYVLRTTFVLLMIFDSHSSGCFHAQKLVNAMNFQHWMPSAQPEPSCSLGLENQFSQPWWNVATNEPPSHQDMLSLFQSPISYPSEFSNISVSFSARNPCQRQGGLHGSDQFNHCLSALLKSSAPIFQSSQSCTIENPSSFSHGGILGIRTTNTNHREIEINGFKKGLCRFLYDKLIRFGGWFLCQKNPGFLGPTLGLPLHVTQLFLFINGLNHTLEKYEAVKSDHLSEHWLLMQIYAHLKHV